MVPSQGGWFQSVVLLTISFSILIRKTREKLFLASHGRDFTLAPRELHLLSREGTHGETAVLGYPPLAFGQCKSLYISSNVLTFTFLSNEAKLTCWRGYHSFSKFVKDCLLAHVIHFCLLSFHHFVLSWQENFLLYTQFHLEK